jgi:acyl-CoA thioesterase
VISSLRADGEALVCEADPSWGQGRTLYGGMTAALSTQAAILNFPELPPLRSAQFNFIGPAQGRLSFATELLRQGKSSTIIGVDCRNEQGMAARSILTYGADRQSEVMHEAPLAPDTPSADQSPPFFPQEGMGPTFARHFETRLARGSRPLQGGDPDMWVWVRLKDGEGVAPVPVLMALGDSLPPAAMISFPNPGPISTMSWSIDLFRHDAPEGWFLFRSLSEQAKDGYSCQAMWLWDAQGRLVAASRQVVAVFV